MSDCGSAIVHKQIKELHSNVHTNMQTARAHKAGLRKFERKLLGEQRVVRIVHIKTQVDVAKRF